jgi:hypothetical protein
VIAGVIVRTVPFEGEMVGVPCCGTLALLHTGHLLKALRMALIASGDWIVRDPGAKARQSL